MRVNYRRNALTLIELIVVLVILVGLAGVLIPMMPSMLGRTHTATSATNIAEIVKWVQTYEQLYFKYPDLWDALVDETGAPASYVPEATVPQTAVAALTQAQADALNTSGITVLAAMYAAPAADPWNATFNPYTGATIPVALGANVKVLSAAGVARLNLPATGTYLIAGLGKQSTMAGKVMAESPIHFSDSAADSPVSTYNRYAAIFKISDTAVTVSRAILVQVVAMHGGEGLATVGDHVGEYYNLTK